MSLNPALFPIIPPASEPAASRPFWSVIVPAYKREFLADALKSVMQQDCDPAELELIVLDDCSPDQLEPIVREICGDRVRYIRNQTNLGTFATENAGLRICRGIWTHILNDDDWVLPGFYTTLRKSLENLPEHVGAAACGFENRDSLGRPSWTPPAIQDTAGIIPNWLERIGAGNPLHPVAVAVRRSVYEKIGGYHSGLNYCADWEFYKRSATCYAWWFQPQVLACYREHAGNTTSAGLINGERFRNLAAAIELSRQYLPADRRDRITAAAKENYARLAISMAIKSLEKSNVEVALALIQAGVELSSSQEVLQEIVTFLAMPNAAPLRALLPGFFKMIRFQPTQ